MEKKRLVQYLMVLVLAFSIFFIVLVAYTMKTVFITIEKSNQELIKEQCENSVCECRQGDI